MAVKRNAKTKKWDCYFRYTDSTGKTINIVYHDFGYFVIHKIKKRSDFMAVKRNAKTKKWDCYFRYTDSTGKTIAKHKRGFDNTQN